MKKWICKVCGYTHLGDEPPERCPKCGSARTDFYEEGKRSGCSVVGLMFIIMILVSVICIFFFSCSSSTTVDNSAVASLDLKKYMGKWYELARLDHSFERGMTQCTATYSMQTNGKVKVTNQGMKNGKWRNSDGNAKLTDTPGVLRVSFFWPFYSDYRVMMLSPDYSYALVGGSDDSYLWILSRTPQLPQDVLDKILAEARRRGYNTYNLIWVEQGENMR